MRFLDDTYAAIREGCRASASVIVPLLHDAYKPRVVVDVGAGEGWFAAEFAARGCEVLAVDRETPLFRAPGQYEFLCQDVTDQGAFWPDDADLAVCLEVAEHLPERAAGPFVLQLCNAAPVVAFSAAVPGQGGHGHLNEQWPLYWWKLFDACGYGTWDDVRWRLWDDDRVEPWYRQNLIVYRRSPVYDCGSPPAVIHPAFRRP